MPGYRWDYFYMPRPPIAMPVAVPCVYGVSDTVSTPLAEPEKKEPVRTRKTSKESIKYESRLKPDRRRCPFLVYLVLSGIGLACFLTAISVLIYVLGRDGSGTDDSSSSASSQSDAEKLKQISPCPWTTDASKLSGKDSSENGMLTTKKITSKPSTMKLTKATTTQTTTTTPKPTTTTTTPKPTTTTTTPEPTTTTTTTPTTTTTTLPPPLEVVSVSTKEAFVGEKTTVNCTASFVTTWESLTLKHGEKGGVMSEIKWESRGRVTTKNIDEKWATPSTGYDSGNIVLSWNIHPVICGDSGLYTCTLDTGQRTLVKADNLTVSAKPENPILIVPDGIKPGTPTVFRAEWPSGSPTSWGYIKWFIKRKGRANFDHFRVPAKAETTKDDCQVIITSSFTLALSRYHEGYILKATAVPVSELPADKQQVVNNLDSPEKELKII